jgi:hypothetical protein
MNIIMILKYQINHALLPALAIVVDRKIGNVGMNRNRNYRSIYFGVYFNFSQKLRSPCYKPSLLQFKWCVGMKNRVSWFSYVATKVKANRKWQMEIVVWLLGSMNAFRPPRGSCVEQSVGFYVEIFCTRSTLNGVANQREPFSMIYWLMTMT